MTDHDLKMIFDTTKVIASVGLSSNPVRPSYGVCAYLQRQGYRVIPVNPNETEVLGEKAYPDLTSLPPELKPEVVQIFRRPEMVPEIVDEAILAGAKTVWMQDGAGNPEAAAQAEAAGLMAVVDDCMLRQHRRLYATG